MKERLPGKFEEIGAEIGRLVDKKQKAYGDSFGKAPQIIRIMYPNGIRTEQYGDLLTMIRILDKFSRIATDKQALGEDPWQDVAGYALLANRDLEPEADALNRIFVAQEKGGGHVRS